MTNRPHPWQLKGFSQVDFLCRSQFKGFSQVGFLCRSQFKGAILADSMGVGKTLQAVMVMEAVRSQPGFSMVVCPATLMHTWHKAVLRAFEDVSTLRCTHMNEPILT